MECNTHSPQEFFFPETSQPVGQNPNRCGASWKAAAQPPPKEVGQCLGSDRPETGISTGAMLVRPLPNPPQTTLGSGLGSDGGPLVANHCQKLPILVGVIVSRFPA